MKCVICKNGDTESGHTTVTFERDESVIVFKKVPAQVCRNCGEAYIDEEIAESLLESVEEVSAEGVQVDIRQFSAA